MSLFFAIILYLKNKVKKTHLKNRVFPNFYTSHPVAFPACKKAERAAPKGRPTALLYHSFIPAVNEMFPNCVVFCVLHEKSGIILWNIPSCISASPVLIYKHRR